MESDRNTGGQGYAEQFRLCAENDVEIIPIERRMSYKTKTSPSVFYYH